MKISRQNWLTRQFSPKWTFKSTFWQILLASESRHLTVFQIDDKLYRYKVLTVGFKSAQGELSAALKPIFTHIKDAHLIHDDLVVVTDANSHTDIIKEVMEAINKAGLTLNPQKC